MDDSLNLLDGLDDLELPLGPGSEEGPHGAQFFGPYQVIQEVGVGGVARVWRARHIHPGYADKTFAIKILHEELSEDPKVVDLFRAEAYVLSLLKHPNIVETFEAGLQDNKLFIAMEYIDGRDLDNLIVRCHQMKQGIPIPLGLHMMVEVLKALLYAHELTNADNQSLSLVHRDINPANVFLSYDGRVKLGDFGVASIAAGRLQRERELAGKAGYFAPEQLLGGHVDQRADLFAVGVMMFEMLCGARLFQADSVEQLIKLNKKAKIPKPSKLNPQISPQLEAVMLRALQRKPQDRYASGREMLAALTPLVPSQQGLPLGVAALLRKAFSNEHIQELQLREGLAGQSQTRGSGQLIAVVTADPRARAAFNELLVSRGYRVATCDSAESLNEIIRTQPPQGVLVDLCSPSFNPTSLKQAVASSKHHVVVIGFAEGIEASFLQRADAVGAVDLLFKPFNIERVLTAVRAAMTGAAYVATIDPITHQTTRRAKPKVMLISQDQVLIERLSAGLSKRGYEADTCETPDAAVALIAKTSHHAIIYDVCTPTAPVRFFAGKLRSQPGMGLIPILYLARPEDQNQFAGVDAHRSAVRLRDDPPAVAVETLNRLRGDTRLGRTFLRYATDFFGELRYGGRVFEGRAVNLSRGGVMLCCSTQMPPVGTTVGLSLRLSTTASPVQVSGRVARVDLPEANSGEARVGVEFERFAATGEAELIQYLGTLDPNSERPTTLTMDDGPSTE